MTGCQVEQSGGPNGACLEEYVNVSFSLSFGSRIALDWPVNSSFEIALS